MDISQTGYAWGYPTQSPPATPDENVDVTFDISAILLDNITPIVVRWWWDMQVL